MSKNTNQKEMPPMQFEALLGQGLQENNHDLDPLQLKKLAQFLSILRSWNKVFNLTAITEAKEMVYLHILDSLAVAPFLQGVNLCDVGSGAGLPGIPLAIINPQQQWVLVDKNNKKIKFLRQVIAELSLPNVHVVPMRVEDFHPETGFDIILSRALGSLAYFVQVTEHMLAVNGALIALKGKCLQHELDQLPPHFSIAEVSRLRIKGMDAERHIVRLYRSE